jgi:hypothetical protein
VLDPSTSLLLVALHSDEVMRWRVAVPKSLVEALVLTSHTDMGHFEVRKLLPVLSQEFWWPRTMRRDVVRVVSSACAPCARTRLSREANVLGDAEQAGAPRRFEKLEADLFFLKDRWFLTLVESFSGLAWALPLADKSAASVARVFQVSYMQLFGVPVTIQTDHGTEFAGVFDAMCVSLGIRHRRGTVMNSRSQSRVERLHSTIVSAAAKYLLTSSDVIAAVAHAVSAVNGAATSASSVSPFELAFGYTRSSRALNALRASSAQSPAVAVQSVTAVASLPAVVPWPTPVQQQRQEEHQQRLAVLEEVREESRAAQVRASRAAWALTHKGKSRAWLPGDLVWLFWPPNKGASKLELRYSWTGPWCIEKFDVASQQATVSVCVMSNAETVGVEAAAMASSRLIPTAVSVSAHARRLRPFSVLKPSIAVADAGNIELLPTPGVFSSVAGAWPPALESLPPALRLRVSTALGQARVTAAGAVGGSQLRPSSAPTALAKGAGEPSVRGGVGAGRKEKGGGSVARAAVDKPAAGFNQLRIERQRVDGSGVQYLVTDGNGRVQWKAQKEVDVRVRRAFEQAGRRARVQRRGSGIG